jgi:hypothetical protein
MKNKGFCVYGIYSKSMKSRIYGSNCIPKFLKMKTGTYQYPKEIKIIKLMQIKKRRKIK